MGCSPQIVRMITKAAASSSGAFLSGMILHRSVREQFYTDRHRAMAHAGLAMARSSRAIGQVARCLKSGVRWRDAEYPGSISAARRRYHRVLGADLASAQSQF